MKMQLERIHNIHEGSGTFVPDNAIAAPSLPLSGTDHTDQLLPILRAAEGRIAFMFPGQGSQFINMGIDLYREEPVFTAAVDECAGYINSWLNEDIRSVMYPQVVNSKAQDKLNDTYYTQAAISAISYALGRLWMSRGIYPSMLIGHSIGEFMAAHFAGIYSLRDALYLITMRGRMMAGQPRGSMLAVRASAGDMAGLLPGNISLAAINTHESCVVAGPVEAIAHFSRTLSEKGIASRLLKTSHAFHSFMMEPMVARFQELAAPIERHTPKIPVISTVTGQLMTNDEAVDVTYWSKNIITPVCFATAVDTLFQTDMRVILEVGPGNVTSRFVQQMAGGQKVAAVQSMIVK